MGAVRRSRQYHKQGFVRRTLTRAGQVQAELRSTWMSHSLRRALASFSATSLRDAMRAACSSIFVVEAFCMVEDAVCDGSNETRYQDPSSDLLRAGRLHPVCGARLSSLRGSQIAFQRGHLVCSGRRTLCGSVKLRHAMQERLRWPIAFSIAGLLALQQQQAHLACSSWCWRQCVAPGAGRWRHG